MTPTIRRIGIIPSWAQVWALNAVLALAALVIYATFLHDRPALSEMVLPWPLLAAAFALAELKVVEVHFRREAHSFSLSEFPAVIGFFFLSPTDYLLAVLVGAGAVLVFRTRQRIVKVAFNLANFMFVATVSLAIFALFVPSGTALEVQDWIGTFLATSAAMVLSALSIATVITLSGGAPQFEKLPEMLRFGGMVSFANTSLALLAVAMLKLDAKLLWLLVIPLGIVFVAYRAFLSEREKHERLELVYESSRILQHSPELDSALIALLNHAREMFRAETAEVVLYDRGGAGPAVRTTVQQDRAPESMVPVAETSRDPMHQLVQTATGPFFHESPAETRPRQRMVSPLRGESELIGSFVIANRLTEGTSFQDDDLPLLETLANQLAVALENGHLEQSLSQLSRLKEELRYQAFHDPLTRLPNRAMFVQKVAERLADVPAGGLVSVLFLDLDDFKLVNDTLGHSAGDELLVEVAERLRHVLRADDTAARLGGDEFAVVLVDEPDLAVAMSVAERIVDALGAAFLLGDREVHVGGSIGLAAARLGSEQADELLRNADVAMYTAKSAGKNRVAVFEPEMHTSIVARHELSAELSRSLGRGELLLLYQPILDLATLTPTGVEALVRWRHPTRGLILPDEFIPIAEEMGTIKALGTWVLVEACRQMAEWNTRAGDRAPLSVTVNLAAQQLQEISFVDQLAEILRSTGLPATQLVLEMTETVMFRDTTTTIERLERIRELGVRIAIDDFGTGYSSLGYLRRFPVDILKIAREFIGQTENVDEWPFAAAIVALGRALRMNIIAEGIEEPAQLAHLRALGCEFGQGYLFARPLEPLDAEAFLRLPAHGSAEETSRGQHDPGPKAVHPPVLVRQSHA